MNRDYTAIGYVSNGDGFVSNVKATSPAEARHKVWLDRDEAIIVAVIDGHHRPSEEHTPRYEHDCDVCSFLGQHGDADLYVCSFSKRPQTVIARYSDEPHDYASGLGSRVPDLQEAERRARERGMLA
jgi:hypothetical protein